MSSYTVAHLDEIDEISDGRCPWRPVRHHFGISDFDPVREQPAFRELVDRKDQ